MPELARQRFDLVEYLQLEDLAEAKHEFLDGHVWAMAGGSPEHAAISGNVTTLLSVQLHGQRCRVFSADLRIRVQATGLVTYPDVSVVCGRRELDPDDRKGHTVTNPRVLVEVLSPPPKPTIAPRRSGTTSRSRASRRSCSWRPIGASGREREGEAQGVVPSDAIRHGRAPCGSARTHRKARTSAKVARSLRARWRGWIGGSIG